MGSAPKFEKANHHWVPQFWLRRFRGGDNQLRRRIKCESTVGITSTSHIMSADWLYTVFDGYWQPSDRVEDMLSVIEGRAGKLFSDIGEPNHIPSSDEWDDLIVFLALSACRHPRVMERSLERARALAFEIADVDQPDDRYAARLKRYGLADVSELRSALADRGEDVLLGEAEEIAGLSPQDPRLPSVDALWATPAVAAEIGKMDLRIVTAPPGVHFILGDAPVPLHGLSQTFCVPLGKDLAVWAEPGGASPFRGVDVAQVDMVEDANQNQWVRAEHEAVGPSEASLSNL